MTELWGWWPAGGWQRLAADAAWQGMLVGTAAMVLLRLARLRPATRSALALVAVLLSIAAPIGSAVARYEGWGLLARDDASGFSGELVARIKREAHAQKAVAVRLVDSSEAAEVTAISPRLAPSWGPRVLAAAWLAVSFVLLLRLARSMLAVRRACRTTIECSDAQIHAALMQAARTIRVRPPLLRVSSTIQSPALVPWGEARLLIPSGAEPGTDWYAVFCHELAHLARRDGIGRLVCELAVAAFPWQPLLWLLRREFRVASEEACDDWAVASGADPVEFASVLLDFVPQARPALVLGMSESVATTRSRIMRLLAMQGSPRPGLGRWLGISGWVVAGLLAVILALLQSGRFPFGGEQLPPWGNMPIEAALALVPPSEELPLKPYRVEAPDVLLIDAVKVVPKPPYHIEPLDTLEITVLGTLPDQNIAGPHAVDADGTITLGAAYGQVAVAGMTLGEARDAIRNQLENILTAPEVSLRLGESAGQQQIEGEHLIGPDGTVTLGVYGSVHVAGKTLAETRRAIEEHLAEFLENPKISVDVFAYNSKYYYVVFEGGSAGDQIQRIPYTGHETFLDALAQVSPNVQPAKNAYIWVARPAAADGSSPAKILPVDWRAILRGESNATNYWILPGDRIFISAPGGALQGLLKKASDATGIEDAISTVQQSMAARY